MSDKTLDELAEIADLMQQTMELARSIRSMIEDDLDFTSLFQASAECLVHRLIRIDELIKGVKS